MSDFREVGDGSTYGSTVATLQTIDQEVQVCENTAKKVGGGLGEMTTSQGAVDAALTNFKLDDRTLGASKKLQEATRALERIVADGAAAAREVSERSQAALESVNSHRQLAEAVQSHEQPAEMAYYRGGR